ncbi:MAG: DUF5358 family protein [Pelistega sp.]|nr:DUF5358 family protein [Pelistega sp.]
MLKKIVSIAVVGLLTACSSTPSLTSSSEEGASPTVATTEVSNRQLLTDEIVVQWITQLNNAEQCVYPQLAGLNTTQANQLVYDKLSPAELEAWKTVQQTLLRQTMGAESYRTLMNSSGGAHYVHTQFLRLNHQNVTGMSATECALFKQEFSSIAAAKSSTTKAAGAKEAPKANKTGFAF